MSEEHVCEAGKGMAETFLFSARLFGPCALNVPQYLGGMLGNIYIWQSGALGLGVVETAPEPEFDWPSVYGTYIPGNDRALDAKSY
jgi:hypothetical protein